MIAQDLIRQFWGAPVTPDSLKAAREHYKAVRIHSQGDSPKRLLDRTRPNEQAQHKQYRLDTYKPITKAWYGKVMTQLRKIRGAEDWRITWPDSVKDNPLRLYCEGSFPSFDTVENWFFESGLNQMIEDPNGVFVILPKNINKLLQGISDPSEYLEPAVFFYNCDKVLEATEDLVVVTYHEGAQMPSGELDPKNLKRVVLMVSREEIVKVKETRPGRDPELQIISLDGFAYMPAFQAGGVLAHFDPQALRRRYESFISPALAHWEEAIERRSDHILNMVLHLHPDRWQYVTQECSTCRGGGKVKGEKTCDKCHGSGYVYYVSPFGVTPVAPVQGEEGKMSYPTGAPAGYIERPIESIAFLKQEVKDCLQDGLFSLNLEVLGLGILQAQSGLAKAWDRADVNAFINSVALQAVSVLKNVIYFVNEWRFYHLTPELRAQYLPGINTPTKFDFVTVDALRERLNAEKTGGGSPFVIASLTKEIARREHGPDSPEYLLVRDGVDLDPLYGKTDDEKANTLLNGGISKVDYVMSSQLPFLLRRALVEEGVTFFAQEFEARLEVLRSYAQETVDAAEPAPVAGVNFGRGAGSFSIGETVMVKSGKEHMPSHKGIYFKIAEVEGDTYALKLPDGSIHKWYTGEELMGMSSSNKPGSPMKM